MAVAWDTRRSHTERVFNRNQSGPPPQRTHYHVPAILIATAGMGVCVVALFGFMAMVATNNLPWHPDWTIQDHYLEIGRSYSQGFIIGFFLCFFLIMGAVSIAALFDARRRAARTDSGPSPQDVRAA